MNRIKIDENLDELTSQEYRQALKGNRLKYNNVKTIRDGFKFDSKREADYYSKLKVMEENHEIKSLRKQVPFQLFSTVKGLFPKMTYKADFTYLDKEGKLNVIDVKGVKTPVYKIKKRLMYEVFGILIKEV